MTILFKPNGTLDIATDPSDLPETAQDRDIYSEAFARCKNLRLDRKGQISLRHGSNKLNATAINTAIWLIMTHRGVRYAFAGTDIYKDEVSIATVSTSAQWSAIKYNSYLDTKQQIFATNGESLKRIDYEQVYEWGIAPPTNPPTCATGSLTGLTGSYRAKYTYLRKVGNVTVTESNPSPASVAVSLTNQSLSVTWDASSDAQVTHVRIYRTLANGETYYEDRDIIIGTLTVDTNTADGSLDTEVATNHDRPPSGASFVYGPAYNGSCFIIKDNLLYYCLEKQPEYWPATNFIEVSQKEFPGKCVVFHNGQTYYLTRNKIYYIQGSGAGTYFPLPMESKTGAQGIFGAVSVEGDGIYHTGNDGIYLFANGADKKITSAQFEPIFRGETVNDVPGVMDMTTAWLHVFENHLYLGYQASGETYPANVLKFDLGSRRANYYNYNDGAPVEIRCITTDDTNGWLLVGDNTGFIRRIEDNALTTDSATSISWEMETKEFTLSTRAHFPRTVKYDVDASLSDSCVGTVLLDGNTHQTHTITGDRITKARLVDVGNGQRESIRLSGTGPVTIYAIEAE